MVVVVWVAVVVVLVGGWVVVVVWVGGADLRAVVVVLPRVLDEAPPVHIAHVRPALPVTTTTSTGGQLEGPYERPYH